MDSKMARFGLLIALFGVMHVQAADLDQMDGLQLYNKECSVCHGNLAQKTGQLPPARPVQVAIADADGVHDLAGERLAVVPIYGPPLSGVIGRKAGTFSGYAYSKSFLQKMDGVVWDETKLETWIKSSQTMVPGSYMFYSQKKPEVRSKIVQYLKEHSQ